MLLLASVNLYSQDSTTTVDTTKQKMFEWFAFPFIFYTPEVNFAFGAGGIAYFRTSMKKGTRPSKIISSAYYSINDQYLVSLTPSVFFNRNRNEASSEIYFEKKIDEFYGIGNNSSEISTPDYQYENFSVSARIKQEFLGKLKVVAVYEFMNYYIADIRENPYLNNDVIYGSDGGVNSGLGYGITLDNRNNIFYPSHGTLLEFNAVYFASVFGSDYNFDRYIFDLRYYRALSKNNDIIALQGYAAHTIGSSPFYALPKLGGQHMMRGYYEGRYRDKNYLTAQIEYRKTLLNRINFILFLGFGDVGKDLNDFSLPKLKYSFGGGLRYVLDENEKLNIRVDIGYGDSVGFYFGVEEAF
ncbi:MAG: BamA/TamA family outer membrane protein [Bacteroidota bacterium]